MNGSFICVSGEKDPERLELWKGDRDVLFYWSFFPEKESSSVQWKEQQPSQTLHSICFIYYQHFCKPVSLCKMLHILFAKEELLLQFSG